MQERKAGNRQEVYSRRNSESSSAKRVQKMQAVQVKGRQQEAMQYR